jgi:hypothetical protein
MGMHVMKVRHADCGRASRRDELRRRQPPALDWFVAARAEDRKQPFRRRGLVEVLVSPNGSWTMLLTYPSHPTCVVATGVAWEILQLAGQPA